MASSTSQGQFVVASTMTFLPPWEDDEIPSICDRSSLLNLRLASCSPSWPLLETCASTSSKKMMEGA